MNKKIFIPIIAAAFLVFSLALASAYYSGYTKHYEYTTSYDYDGPYYKTKTSFTKKTVSPYPYYGSGYSYHPLYPSYRSYYSYPSYGGYYSYSPSYYSYSYSFPRYQPAPIYLGYGGRGYSGGYYGGYGGYY